MTPMHNTWRNDSSDWRYIGGMDEIDIWLWEGQSDDASDDISDKRPRIHLVSGQSNLKWASYSIVDGRFPNVGGDDQNSAADPVLRSWVYKNMERVIDYLRCFAPELQHHL